MAHHITITLPDRVYEVLSRQAKAQQKSVRKIAEETLQKATFLEEATLPSLESEQHTLVQKNDSELWQLAESQWAPSQERKWRRLIAKRDEGRLTEAQEKELGALVADWRCFMVIQSEAWVLLKQRGHRIPTAEELEQRARAKGWLK